MFYELKCSVLKKYYYIMEGTRVENQNTNNEMKDENKSIKTTKISKKKVVISIVITAFIIVGLISIYRIHEENKQIQSVVSLIKSKDYDNANEQFTEIKEKSNKKIINRINKNVNIYLDSLFDEYIVEEINSDELKRLILFYEKIGLEYDEKQIAENINMLNQQYIDNTVEYQIAFDYVNIINDISILDNEASDIKKNISQFKNSREAFEKAEQYNKDKVYIKAITEYSKVINEDTILYDSAQEQKTLCLNKLYDESIDKASNYHDKGEYIQAYKCIKDIKEFYDENKIKEYMDKYLKSAFEDAITKAEEYATDGKYFLAIDTLDANEQYYRDDSDLYNKLQDKIKSYKEQKLNALKKRKDELLTKVAYKYDEIDDLITIVPKGLSTRYININEYLNITPRIHISNNVVNLLIVAGFAQDDWVFFDEVSFLVDNQRFSWNVDYGDRFTDVGWGDISEWYFALAYENSNLINQITKIVNSDSATMRFSGEGYRDHIITKKEKKDLKTLLELYSLYDQIGGYIIR